MRRLRWFVAYVGWRLVRLGGWETTDVDCPFCEGMGDVVHDIDCEVCVGDGGAEHARFCPMCQGAAVLDAVYRWEMP